jgi:YcxB-like protein
MPVNLQFTLTFEDYLNAQRLHARKNWWLCLNYFAARYVLPVLGVLLILLGFLIFGHAVPSMLSTINFGLGVFFVLYPWYYRARLKRCYLRTRTGKGETSVELGDETIRVMAENVSSDINWKAVQSCREDKNVFLLYLAPAKFIVLPKREFSPDKIVEARSLLTQRAQPVS